MSTDTLSDVLRAVRLTGAVFFSFEGSTPWVAEAPPAREIGAHLMPDVEHVIEYHVMKRGCAWGGIVGEEPLRLETGDVIVFPQGHAHVLSSEPGLRAPPERSTSSWACTSRNAHSSRSSGSRTSGISHRRHGSCRSV